MKSKPLNNQHAPLLDSGEVVIGPLANAGSSGAELWLVQTANNDTIVRKSTSLNPVKLYEQFCWLNENSDLGFFPTPFNSKQGHEFFSYDMPYYKNTLSLNHILSSRDKVSKTIMSDLFLDLKYKFYKELDHSFSITSYEYYLSEKFFKKVKYCELVGEDFGDLFTSDILTVNGKRLHNFPSIWRKLHSPETHKLLRSFNNKAIESIHGDLTAENILISDNNQLILLDPNQENLVSTYAVEVAKVFQSLHSNYEHLANCHFEHKDSYIDYNYVISPRRRELSSDILDNLISSMLLSRKEILFHEAIHFARMLPYKMKRGKYFVVYYARMIELFNQVLW